MKLTLDDIRQLDFDDPLQSFRGQFLVPPHENGEQVYFCGNSLGLLAKNTERLVKEEMHKWATHGVEGHFEGARPWVRRARVPRVLSLSIRSGSFSRTRVLFPARRHGLTSL